MAVKVRFQHTPNPNAGKFVVDRQVVEGSASKSYYGPDQAQGDPVAAALFRLDGVASLFMVEDFITVMKRPDAGWERLVPDVVATIEASMS
jgi:hypothetical protein